MKTLSLATAAALALLASAGAAAAADVTVTVSGVQARGGSLLGSLQTREQFMRGSGVRQAVAKVNGAGAVTLTFKDVPAGDYAVSVMHDQNDDRQMNLAPSGIPAEGVATSGSHRGFPRFEDAAFKVGDQNVSTSASMLYMDGKIPGSN